jgi:hypothetical protein
MSLALSSYSYPLLAVFLTILYFLLFVIWIWIWILIWICLDIFRSRDLAGGAKALWFLFVLFIPLVGVLVYLIARATACTNGWWGSGGTSALTPWTPRDRRVQRTSWLSSRSCATGACSAPPSSSKRRPRSWLERDAASSLTAGS